MVDMQIQAISTIMALSLLISSLILFASIYISQKLHWNLLLVIGIGLPVLWTIFSVLYSFLGIWLYGLIVPTIVFLFGIMAGILIQYSRNLQASDKLNWVIRKMMSIFTFAFAWVLLALINTLVFIYITAIQAN